MKKCSITRRSFIYLLSCSPFIYAQTLNKERIWQNYLEWFKSIPIDSPGNPIPRYQVKLLAGGIPESQVDQYIAVIKEFWYSRNEGMTLYFNKMYNKGFVNQPPNSFLIKVIQDLKPGAALDVSMGEGRNSIYLAKSGWNVTGFDISDNGLSIARRNAEKLGLKIKTVLSGYQDFDFGKNQWDLVAMMYAFFPIRNEVYINRLKDSIRPGGVLVFEHLMSTGSADEREEAGKVGMPVQNELLKIFDTFRVLRYEESDIIPDWGSSEPAPVVRLLAQKR